MATSSTPQPAPSKIVAVQVVVDRTVALDPFAMMISENQTFSKLFEQICQASQNVDTSLNGARFKRPIINVLNDGPGAIKCVIKSPTSNSPSVEVGLSLPVVQTLDSFSLNNVSFIVTTMKPPDEENVFTMLMQGQKRLQKSMIKYPETFGQEPVSRGDWKLKNDFISLLEKNEMGFLNGEEKTFGKSVVNSVCDCLFYILPHLSSLSGRYVKLHSFFDTFYDTDNLAHNVYNDPTKYKCKAKSLEKPILCDFVQSLFKTLAFPCLSTGRMVKLKEAILDLANSLSKYVDYLGNQNKRMTELHNLSHPARTPDDGVSTKLQHIPGRPRSLVIANKYEDLEKSLVNESEYVPISLTEFYPVDRQRRYHYIQEIQLPFDVTIYQYSAGGPTEDLYFIWKCGDHLDLQEANKVIHDIEQNIKVYHTRAMYREFHAKFDLVSKVHPTILNEMYRQLSNDSSAIPCQVSKDVRHRLLALIDSQNTDLVFDMRALHEGNPTKFDEFFSEVEKFLNEYELKAVDDRRHGLISHMAVAMSVRDLHEQISLRLPSGTSIPSVEWLRLQFMPKNPSMASAVNYSGRFPLKYRIQSRQFNMFHVDAHYVSALQKYLKQFAVRYRDNCVLLSVDDKNHIPVGEPGVPIATIYRSKKSVSHSEIPHLACDHDTGAKLKISPSVALQVDIPETLSGDFYNGQVCVTLKDTVFQPSNPLRHVAEMRQFLGSTGQLGQPIRLIYSDGGPDHRITYPSVKLGLIAMFLLDDCDFLLAMRTAPHQSYRNWVERIMSILNLALQTIAIERHTMATEMENILKNLVTMNSMRQKAEQNETFKSALMDSLDPVKKSLNELFQRLSLKDTPFKIDSPATDVLMDELWDTLHTLDETVQRTDTQSKQLQKRVKLSAFMDHCTVSRKYYFLIRKCGQETCEICRPPRLDPDTFASLHIIPDPEPSVGEPLKYKSFDELYGKETTESFCPSLKQPVYLAPDGEVDLPNIKMTGETVRDYMCCLDCNKPRCIYSPRRFGTSEKRDLDVLKEECVYSCGGLLIPKDHILFNTVISEMKVTCSAPVTAHYYSARTAFPLVCFNCGERDTLPISNDMKRQFQSLHPVCQQCKENNINERTRGPRQLKRKK